MLANGKIICGKYRPSIKLADNAHDRNAGTGVRLPAIYHRSLNRRSAAQSGQKRGMHIDGIKPGHGKNSIGQNKSISSHCQKIGLKGGQLGLSLGDVLVGYATSAPPTFLAKLIFGLACGFMAHQVLHLAAAQTRRQMYTKTILAGVFACLVNVLTEPVIRWAFKVYVLGLPEQIAYLSAVNCAISMAVNSLPSIAAASFLYAAAKSTVFRYRDLSGTRQIAADQQDDTAEKQEPART